MLIVLCPPPPPPPRLRLGSPQGFQYESTGFNRLAAQRPHILLAAIAERKSVSRAVLYSDMDVAWRSNPLPDLRKYLDSYDVVGQRDDYLICTGLFMFSTRWGASTSPPPPPLFPRAWPGWDALMAARGSPPFPANYLPQGPVHGLRDQEQSSRGAGRSG